VLEFIKHKGIETLKCALLFSDLQKTYSDGFDLSPPGMLVNTWYCFCNGHNAKKNHNMALSSLVEL